MVRMIRVRKKGEDSRVRSLRSEIGTVLKMHGIGEITIANVFRVEGCSADDAHRFAQEVLCDPITETHTVDEDVTGDCHVVHVAYTPGVTNPEAASLITTAHHMGISEMVAADSSVEYTFPRSLTDQQVQEITERLLMNRTVHTVVRKSTETLVVSDTPGGVEIVPIRKCSADGLQELSKERSLFLNLEEMEVIQSHFRELGRDPTDGELETIAQTWSEHCGHKTFKARLIVDGENKPPLYDRLKGKALQYSRLILSAFVDNAGVVQFYDDFGICAKMETHNSPSALEPYGGSMTGVGGCLRDVMGTGQGANLLASTDIFCFAPWDLDPQQLPPGCLPPRYLLQHVVRGVRDYGNRMGVPTLNGSVHFHPDFRAKPTVLVGCFGILPVDRCQKGVPQVGDIVIAVGGRTGRDGIHGATFSSGVMTAHTATINGTAVQIGNAIEEQRMATALIACRDADLVVAITDCGAGGFASAIGEMGSKTGVKVKLEKAPLKYPGLAPWEILLSESQEQMVVAVRPANALAFIKMCSTYNVEATIVGEFTGDHRFTVTYNNESVCDLSMEFLHDGLPQRVMIATKPPGRDDVDQECPSLADEDSWKNSFLRVMEHPDVCSKQSIVSTYDHTVKANTMLPPFSGIKHDGPNDAAVLCPIRGRPYGMVVSHGLNPVLNTLDPWWGSIWAGVEALANYVAVGGNFRAAALVDNFIWPFPDEYSLWELDCAIEACVKIMEVFGIPFVSGKDSLSSTYRNADGSVLKIPPVLNISAFGRIPDVRNTVTSDFKQAGSVIALLGIPDYAGMGGSVLMRAQGLMGGRVPQARLETLPGLFDLVHRNIVNGNILACHDVSEGGLAACLAEMCFGGDCGADIVLPSSLGSPEQLLFNESPGCFLVEMKSAVYDNFIATQWDSVAYTRSLRLGRVTGSHMINVEVADKAHSPNIPLFSIPVYQLKHAWQRPMKEVMHS